MEDVLEEIVGDIEDEHDVPVPKLKLARVRTTGGKTVLTPVFKPREGHKS